jgi:single-stranded-DNA-specific exonuclease
MSSFFNKNWHYRLQEKQSKSSLVELFLESRAIDEDQLNILQSSKIGNLSDPNEFKDLPKALSRIFNAIDQNEPITVFGDFDLDGISATAIVYETLRSLGAKLTALLPKREDGFGLTAKYVEHLKNSSAKLVITVDCGIANKAEITELKEQGIDTIITDHHSLPPEIPNALAIIHPQYPTVHQTDFTGAGVAFKLAQGLIAESLKRSGRPATSKTVLFLERLLEFAALGTIADLGKLINENRLIVKLGLNSLRRTKNPGMRQLLKKARINPQEIDVEKVAFFLAPRLNAAGRIAHPIYSLYLLLGDQSQAEILESLNNQRRDLTQSLMREILNNLDDSKSLIIARSKNYHPGIIGLLAGRLADQFGKPAIVLFEAEDYFFASCRGPEDFHFTSALKEVEELLIGYGGHQQAAGFSLKTKNFKEFSKKFTRLVNQKRGSKPPKGKLLIDSQVESSSFCLKQAQELIKLAPFGTGFEAPIFSLKKPQLKNLRCVGRDSNHLTAELNNARLIGFSCAQMLKLLKGKNFELALTPDISTWKGKTRLELKIVDARSLSS